jgi:4-hydroxy-2-oxoheptanedioate aldolase
MTEINGWISIPNPFANLIFARAGWDSVTLDAQHGLFDERSITDTLIVLSAALPRRLVRIAQNDPGLVGKALDAGADGVIAPMINSAEDAGRLAGACWYPPRGARSFGPVLAASRAGAQPYAEFAAGIAVWAMIETRHALSAADAIAAVPGITGLYVGPNDLGLSLGLPPGSDRQEPEMLEAFATVIAAAKSAGKSAGIFCAGPAHAKRMASLGFAMVTAGADAQLLAESAARACVEAKEKD